MTKQRRSIHFCHAVIAIGVIATLSHAGATATEIRVLVDSDDNVATGCSVATVDGTFAGVEHLLVATVDDLTSEVVAVDRAPCVDPGADLFGSPVPVASTTAPPWNVGQGTGPAGTDVIEFDATAAELGIVQVARIGFESENDAGDRDALLTTTGAASGSPIRIVLQIEAIPTASGIGLIVFGLVLLVGGFAVLRRRPGPAGLALLLLCVAGGAGAVGFIVLDGEIGDWAGAADAVASDAVGDAVFSTDLHGGWLALTPNRAVIAFRLDMTRDQPAVATDDTATVTEDDPATTLDVLDNDSDPDGDPFVILSATQPANGSVVVAPGGGDLTYQPNPDFCNDGSPTDDFTYTITGGGTATVAVTVTCADDAAVAVNDVSAVTEDDPATAIDVLDNDSDPEGDSFTITGVTQPAGGSVVITGGGTGLTYQPDPDFCNDGTPTDDFTYTITGGATATVAVTVACVDDAAVAVDDVSAVAEDDPATAIDVLDNDSDPEGDSFTISGVTQPPGGAVVITGGGTGLTYQPDPDFCNDGTPTDDFTYTITGGDTATVAATVTCVDDAAVAVDDVSAVTEDDPATAIDVLDNDSDPEGDSFTISGVTQPPGGTVVITGGGAGLTYQPDPNFCNDGVPTDDFTYTITGGDTGLVAVTVVCVNDPPVAGADAYLTVGNTELTVGGATATSLARVVDGTGVLANDADPVDGSAVFIAGIGADVTPPFVGTTSLGGDVEMAADGSFVYVPPAGVQDRMGVAADSFQYILEDADGAQALGTVTLEIEDALVWWVHNDPAGEPLNGVGGDGRSNDPFDILGDGGSDATPDDPEDASGDGDVIFIFAGDGTSSGHNLGIELKSGQQLLGHRSATLDLAGVTIQTPGAADRPNIGNASGAGVTVAANAGNGSRQGISVQGLNVVASGIAINAVAANGQGLDIALSDVVMASVTDTALVVDGTGSPNAALIIQLDGVESSSASSGGMVFENVVFDADPATAGLQPVSAGPIVVGDPVTPSNVTGQGLRLHGVRGSLSVADLTVGNDGGTGLWIRDADGKAGTFAFTTLGGRLVTTGGAAVDIDPVTLNVALSEISSAGSPGSGVLLDTVAGSLMVTGTTTISGSGGAALRVANSPGASLDFGQTTVDGPSAAGIDLATNNAGLLATFDTLDVTTSAGFGLLANGSGTVNINSTSAVISATGGPAVDLTATAGQTNGGGGWTFHALNSTNSVGSGIRLVNLPSPFTATGGTVTGSAAQSILVSGGGQNATIGAGVANPAGRPVEVTGRTGGMVQFSGPIAGVGSPGILITGNSSGSPAASFTSTVDLIDTVGDALTISANAGATISFADLDIDTSTGNQRALLATNNAGGRLNIDTGTINAGTARAVDIDTTALGNTSGTAAGLTLVSVRSVGGTEPGIDLEGTTGAFSVIGDGSAVSNGSGGTISNKAGAGDGTDAVRLVNATNVQLSHMNLLSNNRNGVYGSGVVGLRIDRCNITENGDQTSPTEGNIRIDELTGTLTAGSNPTSITNSLLRNSRNDNALIRNTSGTLADLVVGNTVFRDTQGAGLGSSGLVIDSRGSAQMKVSVTGSTFDGNKATGFIADTSGASSTVTAVVSGSTFTDNNVATTVSTANGGNAAFEITNNTAVVGHASHGLNTFSNASSTGTIDGTYASNVIGSSGTASSGSNVGNGIRVAMEGSGTYTVAITGNTIQEVANFEGIYVSERLNPGDTHVHITGNTVDAIDFDRGINVESRNTGLICADIQGNAVTNTGSDGIRVRQRDTSTLRVERYTGGGASTTDMSTHLATENPAAASTAASVATTFDTPVADGACRMPAAIALARGQ
jgi:VCBS repeat-containing protein